MRTSNNDTPRRNVADTSRECFNQIKKEGQLKKEAEIVLQLISDHQPITSRRISYLTKIERTNITRSLYDLEAIGRIKHPVTDKCPVTNKRVRFYTLIDWEAKTND
jgi:predicted transcriptional regulator